MKTATGARPALHSLAGIFWTLFALSAAAAGPGKEPPNEDLTGLDLAALMQMDVEVTTASKNAQSIYEIAAPIDVITAEDIRRAGATTIPDAIRLAPGVMVGQIDPGKWVVSLRGFGWQYANKALILLDGRAVYSPLASNVYFNTLDVPIEDIERIEVIRGPGDARWGSHAVNGIVNIITYSASQVRGMSLSALVDSDATQIFTARGGGALSSNFNFRAYAKHLSQGDFAMVSGAPRLGRRDAVRAGLRVDGANRNGDRLIFIGDVQRGSDATFLFQGPGVNPILPLDTDEWSALTRWERGESGRLKQQAQLSFDRLNQSLYEVRETLDFAYQAQLPEWRAQTWTFGTTYKRAADELTQLMSILPLQLTQNIYGVFVHDNIALGAKTRLMLGSQFEHNPFTGWEAQPNLQFLYTPRERRSYWASVSRAVRAPMRNEDGFQLETQLFPGVTSLIQGDHDLKAESVLAWQAGARFTVHDNLFLNLAAFYNEYKNLVIMQAGQSFLASPPPRLIFPLKFTNVLSGYTKGVEASVKAQPFPRWNLAASYSLYSQNPLSDPLWFGSVTAVEHQFQVHSSADIAAHLEWNMGLYYTGRLTTKDVPDDYRLDSQFAWTPWKSFQLAIGVKNALDSRHREVGVNSADAATYIPRTAYLNTAWHF